MTKGVLALQPAAVYPRGASPQGPHRSVGDTLASQRSLCLAVGGPGQSTREALRLQTNTRMLTRYGEQVEWVTGCVAFRAQPNEKAPLLRGQSQPSPG
jgi:hypothetical protein